MASFSLPFFLSGLTQAATGYLQGQKQRQEEDYQRQQQADQVARQQQQQDQMLGIHLLGLATGPQAESMDPSAREAIGREGLRRTGLGSLFPAGGNVPAVATPPAGQPMPAPSAAAPVTGATGALPAAAGPDISGLFAPGAGGFNGPMPSAPTPSAAGTPAPTVPPSSAPPPTAAPAQAPAPNPPPAPAAAGGLFGPPGAAKNLAAMGSALQNAALLARQNGDAEGEAAVLSLQQRLNSRQIRPEDVPVELSKITREGNMGRQVAAHFVKATGELDAAIKSGRVSDPGQLQKAQQLYGQMTALGEPSNPAERAQAQKLLDTYGKFAGSGAVGLDPTSESLRAYRQALEDQKGAAAADRGMASVKGLRDQLKTPGRPSSYYLSTARQMQAVLANPTVAKYYHPEDVAGVVPQDLDPTPKTGETQEQADARTLAATAQYSDDPKEQRRLLRGSAGTLLSLYRSKEFGGLPAPQQQAVIGSINDAMAKVDPGWQTIPAGARGLTPYDEKRLSLSSDKLEIDRNRLQIQSDLAQSLIDFRGDRLPQMQAEIDERKREFNIDHPGGKPKKAGVDADFTKNEKLWNDLNKQLNSLYKGPLKDDIKGVRDEGQYQQGLKAAQAIKTRMEQVGGRIGLTVPAPGASGATATPGATATGGDQVRYFNGVPVTRQQAMERIQRDPRPNVRNAPQHAFTNFWNTGTPQQ